MDKETAYVEEYKALKEEIAARIKGRLDVNSWGLLAIAALYSYFFANSGKSWAVGLLWVPVGLSISTTAHLLEEFRMVAKIGTYIRTEFEPWIRGEVKNPSGWESYLTATANEQEPLHWWSPAPLWALLAFISSVLAIAGSLARYLGYWTPVAPLID